MRLIDADKLDECLQSMADLEWNKQVGSSKGLEDAIDIIYDTPTVNAIVIPEDATNGDMIKAMFPNIKINDIDCLKIIYTGIKHKNVIGFNIDATKEWWNAPYKTESEDNE